MEILRTRELFIFKQQNSKIVAHYPPFEPNPLVPPFEPNPLVFIEQKSKLSLLTIVSSIVILSASFGNFVLIELKANF